MLLSLIAAQGGAPSTPSQGNAPYGTPAYPSNPAVPNPYSTMQPGAQPVPYASSGYPMPQSSTSGSFDLSAIRPVNSGTVHLSDAIAQARSYAAEQGLTPYEQPLSGGYPPHDARTIDSRVYRSRSRSPRRRDPFRDNFNPYRDERRNDRANPRDYGRDRSLSPGVSRSRSSGGAFPPRGANSRDRGVDDDDSEIIEIESSLVGLIIGRQGENLRRVESETSCRVQFMSPSGEPGPYRQCKITGLRARRAEAKAAINRIIEDSGMGALARAGLDGPRHARRDTNAPPAASTNMSANANQSAVSPSTLRDGEACMQIMVPDRTVGLIIGRGGETIRDLQERSGCHINIVSESQSVEGLRPVNLIGPENAAEQAKELILEIVASDSRNVNNSNDGNRARAPRVDHGHDNAQVGGGGDKVNDSIYVPSEAVGMIIGRGGETIREMQNTTSCKINVSQSSGPGEVEREIGLVGSRDAINRAKRAIEDKVEAVRQKNNGGGAGRGGGGGGGRNQQRRDWDSPSYSQQGMSSQPAGSMSASTGSAVPAAPANGAEDPYAAYGGYQQYCALWYAYSQQAGSLPQGGEAPRPPGA
ncbi:uncharacterized protein GGS25DRAFT_207433 [Hypoxylon fragiforme]|uniref:uncharacterized protein n=1 Tax=Hypoxylon fragiforme TaxID=63214 RepID=UPI0020C7146D|nr:uncharacterized protein GGS25DRAFT_207433 [Hypoxylon fragiforme]KAI2611729.1 hypothetical protein GGS25DRAFT_207433 [Hypoxylon fragiforme]